jgi:thioredoxin reductase (NADPH)
MDPLTFSLKKDANEARLEDIYDVVILGGGPAGLTAAIYAARAKLKTLIVERREIGGEAATTDTIDNYPGFPEGINGHALADRMVQQARRFGAVVHNGSARVMSLKVTPKVFSIDGKRVSARSVIIATGTSPRTLGVKGERELKGRGVSYCATSITFVEFLPQMRAERILQERLASQDNVEWMLNHEVSSINGEERVESITVKDRKTSVEKKIPLQGVFIYVGLTPNTDILKGQLELNAEGYITTDESLQASLPGIFVAGDVRDKRLRQVATAVGDGAIAAVSAEHFVEESIRT